MPRYDRLGRYLSLYFLFRAIFSLSVKIDRIAIKVPRNRESGQKRSIIIQYVLLQRGMTNYGHTWHSIANSDQFSASAPKMATYGLWRQLVADTQWHGIQWSRTACCRQWKPTMVRNIKFQRVSPFQGGIEAPRSSISGIACTALFDKIGQISSKVAYNGPVFVTVSRYDRLGLYLSLHYLFWAVLALSVRFDHITVKVPGKREIGQKWFIIIQYDLL